MSILSGKSMLRATAVASDYSKQILETAALGAGYRVRGWIGDKLYVVDPYNIEENFDPIEWNPLKNDGDALRLMARLGRINSLRVDIDASGVGCEQDGEPGVICFDCGNDTLAAIRRMIVNVAYNLGKQHP